MPTSVLVETKNSFHKQLINFQVINWLHLLLPFLPCFMMGEAKPTMPDQKWPSKIYNGLVNLIIAWLIKP